MTSSRLFNSLSPGRLEALHGSLASDTEQFDSEVAGSICSSIGQTEAFLKGVHEEQRPAADVLACLALRYAQLKVIEQDIYWLIEAAAEMGVSNEDIGRVVGQTSSTA